VIEIDGSHGEGGGQLVRTTVALAALGGRAVRLVNVRANRPKPGLAPQHLAAVRAVAALCDASCEGLERRSTAFTFEPRAAPRGGDLRLDVGTAGSLTLVLQALLPILLIATRPSRIVLSGGTDVALAPTWDYFERVLLRILRRMGLHVRASLARRGYYPVGGGEVAIEVEPGRPRPLVLEAPAAGWRISGEAHVANLPVDIAQRMRAAALAAAPAGASIGAQRCSAPKPAASSQGTSLRAPRSIRTARTRCWSTWRSPVGARASGCARSRAMRPPRCGSSRSSFRHATPWPTMAACGSSSPSTEGGAGTDLLHGPAGRRAWPA
jgi:RNA 3'-phosphate cyclase